MLYVDTRWRGAHGIGRFSTEVISKLDFAYTTLDSTLAPWSPRDAINSARLSLGRDCVIYTPGYNAGFTSAKQILTIHDLIHLSAPTRSALAKRLYYRSIIRPAILKAGVVMTVSAVSQALISAWLCSPNVRVVNVGNGCSRVFSIDGPRPVMPPYFMYVGNLKPHKNFNVLLQALSSRPQYRLFVVCQDSEAVYKLAAQYGVRSQVSVAKGLKDEDLATYYRGAEALLMPSTIEGFGLPAVEAMACGTPVAGWTGCASVAEIRSGAGVSVASTDDPWEWADAMDRLADAPRLLMSKTWRQKYDWSEVSKKVRRVLSEFA